MCSDIAVSVESLGKCYQIYDKPKDRLKQSLWRGRRQFYREFWALKDISFKVKKGQTFGIIGLNGSGKSTLLQLIAEILSPTNGNISVNGRIAALLELGSGFNPEFTGRENIFLNGAILGLNEDEITKRFDEITAFADIGEFIDQPVKTYSSGMVLRLAFSVSINVDPDILIIDEALAVGDAAFQFKCMQRLNKLTKSGVTLFFVSHDSATIKALCDQVLYLENGCTKALGNTDLVTEQYFMDLRNEQKKTLSSINISTPLKFSNEDNNLSFGSNEVEIIEAQFSDSGAVRAVYDINEPISFKLKIKRLTQSSNLSLSVIIQTTRLLAIFGQYHMLSEHMPDNIACEEVNCCFTESLAPGNYFITLRIEERMLDNTVNVLTKHAGILAFEISAREKQKFLGFINIKMQFRNITGIS